jgi:hypothetical protein
MQRRSFSFVYVICLTVVAQAQMLIHTSQRTPGEPPTRSYTVAAASTSDFLNSLGVACHFNYSSTPYKDFPATKALLVASGIRNIRDGVADPIAVTRLREIKAAGIGVTWIMDPVGGVAPTPAYWTTAPHYDMTYFLKHVIGPGVVDSAEVSNEIDIFYAQKHWHPNDSSPLSADPKSPYFWGSYIFSLTLDTSRSLRADPAFSSMHLLGPTFGGASAGVPGGSLYNLVDLGAFHPYMYRGNKDAPAGIPYDGVPSYFLQSTQPTVYIDEYPTYFRDFQGPYKSGTHQKPMVATETGYYTGTTQYSVSELAQAKYIPRVFAEYFRHSIVRTFIYEFLDEGGDGEMEHSFGLVRSDLTPKPAYTAVQSLTTLLQDGNNSFKPGELTYGFFPAANGAFKRTQYAHDLLLEKSDGDFFLLFWHEISDANRTDQWGINVLGTDIDVSPPALTVTITLPDSIQSATLYTYDEHWKLHPEVLPIRSHQVSVRATDEVSVLQLGRPQ